jgi:NADP-dependent 3-hydroxy acid dehydrogenase YdfG
MTKSLAGRVALVTGASSGIGEAAAIALAEAGADVAISARRADRLEALAKKIEAFGVKALALPGDVVDETVATEAVEKTIAHFGKLDILVNSAGIMHMGTVEATDLAEYRRVMDVNLMGTVYTCKAAIGPMKAQGHGDIVNISSQAGRKTGPMVGAYAASKHALNAMSDSMRQEVGGFGIRVCVLMPGATTTEVATSITDPNFRAAIQTHVTKDGAVAASEIADAIVFVVSQPQRVNIDLISVRPTADTSA